MKWIKEFLTKNTLLLKSIRTLLEVLMAWGVVVTTQALSGTALPPDVQIAVVGVLSAFLAALIGELGKWLPDSKNK